MTKLFGHETTQELTELPELPHDVVVPDDISGLGHDEPTGPRRRGTMVRWLRWMAAAVLLIAGAVVLRTVVGDDDTTPVETTPSAYELVQGEIDQALLENQAATVETTPSAYELIQDEIDQALQENR